MSKTILKVENLVSRYGPITALKGISLEVREGEIVSLLGANGAGKSTLMKSILGMVTIGAGSSIQFDAGNGMQELVGKKSHQIVPLGIAIVPEGRGVFIGKSVEENLEVGTYFRKRPPSRDKELLEMVYTSFPRLKERRKQLAGTLSGGEQQMLAVGRSMMADPKLMILDEPSMGLAPLVVAEVFNVIKNVRDTGITVLLVEQNAKQALKIADRGYVLTTGEITNTGTGAELLADDELIAAYLGAKKEHQSLQSSVFLKKGKVFLKWTSSIRTGF